LKTITLKEDIKSIGKFYLRFGLLRGSILFAKIKLGRVANLRLPNIKTPISLRYQTSDIPTFYQVFLDAQYDIPLKKPRVIIDAGANIGLFTLLMKNKYPEAKIISIEPDHENFAALKKHF
jgi:hypothetical protein